MVNVTGWENLSQGKIPQAAWNLYSEMFAVSPGGPSYFTIIMFLFGSYILYIRTRNLGIVISMQMLFLAVFFPYFGGLLPTQIFQPSSCMRSYS